MGQQAVEGCVHPTEESGKNSIWRCLLLSFPWESKLFDARHDLGETFHSTSTPTSRMLMVLQAYSIELAERASEADV